MFYGIGIASGWCKENNIFIEHNICLDKVTVSNHK